MSITRVISQEDQWMLDTLRELGLEHELSNYEALLRGELPFRVDPKPPPEPVPGSITIAEAAAYLGISRKRIRRNLELGLLKSESDPATGDQLVTNESIAELIRFKRALAVISQPLPGCVDEPPDPNSLLGRMFAEPTEPDEDDEEA